MLEINFDMYTNFDTYNNSKHMALYTAETALFSIFYFEIEYIFKSYPHQFWYVE
jgi:hypothetical protein